MTTQLQQFGKPDVCTCLLDLLACTVMVIFFINTVRKAWQLMEINCM